MTPIETERKYIIEMPRLDILSGMAGYTRSEIEQIYLPSASGVTRRIRRRDFGGKVVYTETVKRRIDSLSSFEDEREISAEEYERERENIAEGSRPVVKCRHTAEYLGKTLEIDIYPEWDRCAVLEVELSSPDEKIALPGFIRVISEVTGRREYSNASLARRFPPEPEL